MPTTTRDAAANPLLASWTTPFGLPPFPEIGEAHYTPAFEAAIAAHVAEIAAIKTEAAAPTFANTLEALERSGRLLTQVSRVFFNLTGTDATPALQAIERDMAPRLSRHSSAIALDGDLFRRIDDLYKRREQLGLEPERLRVLERTHLRFIRAGAGLDAKAKARMAEISERLAVLGTAFAQNVLKDEQDWRLVLDGEADLAGLPQFFRAAARRLADDLGLAGKHAVTLARSSIETFLTFSDRADLRETAFNAWIRRGANDGPTDNGAIAREMIALRAEQARLLGYPTFAHYRLDDAMAKTPEAVRGLLGKVWVAAKARAGEERDRLAALARKEGSNTALRASDWRYWAEKVRKATYDLDAAEIKPYLQLDRMIEAAFHTAGELFGISFREVADAPRYHPDVRVFEVTDKAGRHVGLFLGDYFARPSKRSGAWMSNFRGQWKLDGEVRPIVVNVLNCAPPAKGEPALLSFDDARTLFHEFGHALHGLLSDVTYPSISGTAVSTDFVELPSQLYEHWLETPEILGRFAVHYQTGQPMPKALVERLRAARTFNQGFATVEYVSSALADLELHSITDGRIEDLARFEADLLARLGMPAEIVMRHRLPHFAHVFTYSQYAAGYYSYMWSEVLDADAFAAFEEAGNVFDPATATRLKDNVYAAGNRRDPVAAYTAFRGRLPEPDAMMRRRGLATT